MELCSFPDVPRRSHRKDALIALDEQHPFQKPATLIVKEVFIPFVFHELGYDHDDAAVGMKSGRSHCCDDAMASPEHRFMSV